MIAGSAAQAHDRVAMRPGEPFGLPDPIAFVQVLQDRKGLLSGKTRVEEGRPLALRKPGLAGPTTKHPDGTENAVVVADREVAGSTLPVERAVRVLTTKPRQIVHGDGPS